MPVTLPLIAGVKRVPSSTELGSLEFVTVGVADALKSEHGHVYAGGVVPVVKLQVCGESIARPQPSAASTVAVKVVPAGSWLSGVNVAVLDAASYLKLPGTWLP